MVFYQQYNYILYNQNTKSARVAQSYIPSGSLLKMTMFAYDAIKLHFFVRTVYIG